MSQVENTLVREWWRPGAAAASVPSVADASDDTRGKVAFWSLMTFLGVLVLSPQSLLTFLQPLRIAFLTAGFAVLAYLVHRLATRSPLLEWTPPIRYVTAIVAWAIITLPMSYWPGGSVSFLLEMYFKTLVIFLLLAHVIDSELRLRRVAWALALMSIPLAATGIDNYLSGDEVGGGRIFGYNAPLTANPNDLALTLNLILPVSIGLFLDSTRFAAKVLLIGIIALSVAAVIATFSRSGFLTLAVIGVVYSWNLISRGRAGLVGVVVVLSMAVAPFLPGHYWDRLSTITNIEADTSGSAQERWTDTIAAVKYVGQNPIVGAGIGQNMLAMNEVRGDSWLKVHNVYLVYAVELGLPGLVLYLLLLVSSIRSAGFAQRVAAYIRSSGLFHMAEAVKVSLLAFAVAALFHPSGYHFYFYLFAGLALAARAVAMSRLPEASA